MSESRLVADILRLLAGERRIRAWRNNTGSLKTEQGRWVSFGLEGSADILGILAGGRFLAIEAKSPRGTQTKEQRAFGEMVDRFGGVYVLARSTEDVSRALAPWLTDTSKPSPLSNVGGLLPPFVERSPS